MKFSFDNNFPIYLQIEKVLKTQIVNGMIKPNEKIPSVRALALEYNVNPNTIVKTLAILETEGFIYTDSTNGKYVVDNKEFLQTAKDKLLNEMIDTFLNEMSSLGYDKTDIIKIIEKRG